MAAPTATSGDVIQATINVSIAQSRRLIASWLPPPTQEEIASQKTDEQLAKEDAEIFKPTPPRLGLGAPIPKDFLQSTDPKARRQGISTNEALKRRIMGRGRPPSSNQGASKPRPRGANDQSGANDDDDGNEEEGRSSLGKPKRRKMAVGKKTEGKDEEVVNGVRSGSNNTEGGKEGVEEGADKKATKTNSSSSREEMAKPSSIRFGTYLDVYKAEKANKKRKKRNSITS